MNIQRHFTASFNLPNNEKQISFDLERLGYAEPIFNKGIGPYDVLCGRHKDAFNNVGNRRFRVTVSLALERYLLAPTRQDRSIVIASVVDLVRENGGHFLQWKLGQWVELDDKNTQAKVGHALRDMAVAREQIQANAMRAKVGGYSSNRSRRETKGSPKNNQQPTSSAKSYDDFLIEIELVDSGPLLIDIHQAGIKHDSETRFYQYVFDHECFLSSGDDDSSSNLSSAASTSGAASS